MTKSLREAIALRKKYTQYLDHPPRIDITRKINFATDSSGVMKLYYEDDATQKRIFEQVGSRIKLNFATDFQNSKSMIVFC